MKLKDRISAETIEITFKSERKIPGRYGNADYIQKVLEVLNTEVTLEYDGYMYKVRIVPAKGVSIFTPLVEGCFKREYLADIDKHLYFNQAVPVAVEDVRLHGVHEGLDVMLHVVDIIREHLDELLQ